MPFGYMNGPVIIYEDSILHAELLKAFPEAYDILARHMIIKQGDVFRRRQTPTTGDRITLRLVTFHGCKHAEITAEYLCYEPQIGRKWIAEDKVVLKWKDFVAFRKKNKWLVKKSAWIGINPKKLK